MLNLRDRLPGDVAGRAAVVGEEWAELKIADLLGAFDPVDVSSVSSGFDVPGSDLDIVCDSRAGGLLAAVTSAYGGRPAFQTWVSGTRTMVSFAGRRVGVEISAEPLPVELQQAYRHAVAQRRLVGFGEHRFVEHVRQVRVAEGCKTEPALAWVLGLAGDPYQAVDRLADMPDGALRDLVVSALGRVLC